MASGVALHRDEPERLASLRSYAVLDTAPEAAYDALVTLAARLLGTPMAAISLVDHDRQWLKAKVGALPDSHARELSICSDLVATDAPYAVSDTRTHPRYGSWANVVGGPCIGSYAGAPLSGRDGLPLGALCVLDTKTRDFSPTDLENLAHLATQASALLELRRSEQRLGLHARGSSADRLVADAHDPRALRAALSGGQFVPFLQPVVRLRDETVVGYEALARWQHPVHGLLTPDRFLPAFETGELVHALDVVMLDATLAAVPALRGAGDLHVAVNLSGRELVVPGAAARIHDALDRFGLDPTALVVEVTETAAGVPAIRDRELAVLRDSGVGVLIDDYGVGYSNLLALLDTPATGVKLDRMLVSRISTELRARRLMARVCAAAAQLGLVTIAEGVEDVATLALLGEMQVDYAQGYLFARPAPVHTWSAGHVARSA